MADQMGFETSTALLVGSTDLPKLEADDSFECQNHGCLSIISKTYEDIKNLYRIAFPLIITGLLVYGKSMISMLFMGKLGKDVLAGGSLSAGIANITGYSVLFGLSTGMEGVSSQAYGAKQWPLMTQILHRTILILLLISIPISILWLNIEPLLLLFGQESNISSIASTHLAFSIPDLLFLSFINPLKIHLRSQNLTLPLIISAAFALTWHAPINYLLVYKFRFGVRGIAATTAITDFLLLATLVLYTFLSGIDQGHSWKSWSISCFQEWMPILRLAIPSCLSVCLEWWWYELMIILSGLLPNAAEAVATMGILLQATSLVYIFPSSLSLAVSTRVGNELGANQPRKARSSSLTALTCAFLTSFIAMGSMTAVRRRWGTIFTGDEAVLSLTAMAMPVVGLCELGNCPQTTACGVLRGSARPSLGAGINLGSFYGVGLPMAVIMGFVLGKGFVGFWLGLLSAQIVCTVMMGFVLKQTDWEKQAIRAKELIGIVDSNDYKLVV